MAPARRWTAPVPAASPRPGAGRQVLGQRGKGTGAHGDPASPHPPSPRVASTSQVPPDSLEPAPSVRPDDEERC